MIASPTPQPLPATTNTARQTVAQQLLSRLALDRASCLIWLLLSAVFTAWAWPATNSARFAVLLFQLSFHLLSYYLGSLVLQLIRWQSTKLSCFPMAWLLGSQLQGTALFVVDFLLPVPLSQTALLWGVTVLIVRCLVPSSVQPPSATDSNLGMVWVSLIIVAAVTMLTADLRPFETVEQTMITYHSWLDYLVFAQYTGQLKAAVSLQTLGEPNFVGLRLPFYHYGSFIYPALLSSVSDLPAMDSVCAFWTPLALVQLGFAAYVLFGEWWGSWSGIAAVLMLLLMPDPSQYGYQLQYYSFHWMVAIGPGLAYGIALMALVMLFITRLSDLRLWPTILLCGLLCFATLMYKAHIVIVATPLIGYWYICFGNHWSPKIKVAIGLFTTLAGCAAVWLADRIKIGPNLWPLGHEYQNAKYLFELGYELNIQPGWEWASHFHNKTIARYPLTIWFLLSVELGVCLVAAPCLIMWLRSRRLWQTIDWIPVGAMFGLLFAALVLPANQRGPMDEIWHRPMTWGYFLIAGWTAARGVSLFKQPLWSVRWLVICSSLLLVYWVIRTPAIQARDQYRAALVNIQIDRNLHEAACYVRKHSSETDVVQGPEPLIISYLSAITERRAFCGQKPAFFTDFHLDGTPAYRVCLERTQQLQELYQITNRTQLEQYLQELKINWLITGPETKPAWPAAVIEQAVFCAGEYRVYQVALDGKFIP